MLEQMNIQKVDVPQLITVEDFAVAKFAETGRTVQITHQGEAPVSPIRFPDRARCVDIVARRANQTEIDKLMMIPEMRTRFQILESVPYTDIIIGDEYPTEETLALTRKKKENFHEGMSIFGQVMWLTAKIIGYSLLAVVAVAGVVLGIVGAVLCGKDPIVWARLPSGEWLELARFYQ